MTPPNWDEGTWDSGTWDSPTPPAPPATLPFKKHKTNHKTMASNPTPDNDDVLCALAEDLADGCAQYEVAIGIKQNTETVLRSALTEVNAKKLALGTLKMAQSAASSAVVAADEAGREVIANCRLRLVNLYSSKFGPGWESAGFTGNSTAVPRTVDQRFTLLGKLRDYFAANAASESADLGATAAICGAAHTTLSDARMALNMADTDQSNGITDRNAAVKTLRKRVRGLIDELGTLIAEDDTRWESFGLNIPANPSAPEGIATLTLPSPAAGKIHAEWAYATRMTGTRILTKRIGIDDEFISAGTTEGLEKTLTGFDPGLTVEVQAIPYNDGGDGPGSPVESVVVAA